MPKMSRAQQKLALREQAKRKMGKGSGSAKGQRSHRDKVEAGRKNLLRISSEGGDSKARKVKNELTYLLNNYLPKYDTRIEALIDQWRTSGDPAYDPGVRTKLRNARKAHMRNSNAM
jgi:hypothetical protein